MLGLHLRTTKHTALNAVSWHMNYSPGVWLVEHHTGHLCLLLVLHVVMEQKLDIGVRLAAPSRQVRGTQERHSQYALCMTQAPANNGGGVISSDDGGMMLNGVLGRPAEHSIRMCVIAVYGAQMEYA